MTCLLISEILVKVDSHRYISHRTLSVVSVVLALDLTVVFTVVLAFQLLIEIEFILQIYLQSKSMFANNFAKHL